MDSIEWLPNGFPCMFVPFNKRQTNPPINSKALNYIVQQLCYDIQRALLSRFALSSDAGKWQSILALLTMQSTMQTKCIDDHFNYYHSIKHKNLRPKMRRISIEYWTFAVIFSRLFKFKLKGCIQPHRVVSFSFTDMVMLTRRCLAIHKMDNNPKF